MKLSRNLRAGSRVMSGPSGSPPTGLRGFEVVDLDPNGPPVLDRPQASVVHQRDGAAGWFRAAGVWVSLAALGVLYAATNAFGYLTALGSYLPGLLGSLGQGWRAPVVVHDAAFNAASVAVAGLSSAKRYRVIVRAADNTLNTYVKLLPDGAGANCASRFFNLVLPGGANSLGAGLIVDELINGSATRTSVTVLEPMCDGMVRAHSSSHSNANQAGTELHLSNGSTTVAFTSLTLDLGGTARTGWLKIIEDSP